MALMRSSASLLSKVFSTPLASQAAPALATYATSSTPPRKVCALLCLLRDRRNTPSLSICSSTTLLNRWVIALSPCIGVAVCV